VFEERGRGGKKKRSDGLRRETIGTALGWGRLIGEIPAKNSEEKSGDTNLGKDLQI